LHVATPRKATHQQFVGKQFKKEVSMSLVNINWANFMLDKCWLKIGNLVYLKPIFTCIIVRHAMTCPHPNHPHKIPPLTTKVWAYFITKIVSHQTFFSHKFAPQHLFLDRVSVVKCTFLQKFCLHYFCTLTETSGNH
jgi:hypothetical protein